MDGGVDAPDRFWMLVGLVICGALLVGRSAVVARRRVALAPV